MSVEQFLRFLNEQRGGIFVLVLVLFALVVLMQYLMWIFSIGRYKTEAGRPREKGMNFVFAEAAVKIINDFRHLLALLIVIVFGIALGYAMYISYVPDNAANSVENIKEALQAVVATLGGLVGSIIGYYFGEARNLSSGGGSSNPSIASPPTDSLTPPTTIQNTPPDTSNVPGIRQVQPPPET